MERGENYEQQYEGYQPNYTGMIPNKRTSDTLAAASLIIGIISLIGLCCLGGFLGIVGIILGVIAIADAYCNKKAMAIIGTCLSGLALVLTIICLIVGGSDKESGVKSHQTDKKQETNITNQESDNTDATQEESETVYTENTVYHIGDTIHVSTDNGDYEFTITGVTETDERNQFSDKVTDRVVIIDYEFNNISYLVEYGDYKNNELSISDFNFSMYDADGNVLETYPVDTKYASAVSPGHKSSGQMAYALNNSTNYIEAEYHDNMFTASDLTVILEW